VGRSRLSRLIGRVSAHYGARGIDLALGRNSLSFLRRFAWPVHRAHKQRSAPQPPAFHEDLNKILRAIGWLVAVASAASLAPGATVDLSRETPAPASEQIPIVDFLRPPILWNRR